MAPQSTGDRKFPNRRPIDDDPTLAGDKPAYKSYPNGVEGRINEACLTLFNLPEDSKEEDIWKLFGTKKMPGLKRLKIKGKVCYMDFYHENSLLDQMQQLDTVKVEAHRLFFNKDDGGAGGEKYSGKLREILGKDKEKNG
jgi:hypothetical protein